MRNKISALIIDPHKKDHNYNDVNIKNDWKYFRSYGEIGFDIKVITETSNILYELNQFKGFDCLIVDCLVEVVGYLSYYLDLAFLEGLENYLAY